RIAAFGGDFPNDVHALGFEPIEMGQAIRHQEYGPAENKKDTRARRPVPASARSVGLGDRARTERGIARFERRPIDVFNLSGSDRKRKFLLYTRTAKHRFRHHPP